MILPHLSSMATNLTASSGNSVAVDGSPNTASRLCHSSCTDSHCVCEEMGVGLRRGGVEIKKDHTLGKLHEAIALV